MKQRVSALILTAGRRARALNIVLRALAHQTRLPDEVVLRIDPRASREIVLPSDLPFEVVAFRGTPGGAFAEARNEIVERASGDLLAIHDDDCEPEAHWLERLIAPLECGTMDATGGLVLDAFDRHVAPGYSPDLAWAVGISTPGLLGPLGGRHHLPSTSNLAIRKSTAQQFPFRTVLSQKGWSYDAGREDADLWRRLRQGGVPVGIVGDAIVWHHLPARRFSLRSITERAQADGRALWARERPQQAISEAVRDVLGSPIASILDRFRTARTVPQINARHRVWASRQMAFLRAVVADPRAPTKQQLALAALRGACSVVSGLSRMAVRESANAIASAIPAVPLPRAPRRLAVVLHDLLGDAVLALPMLEQLAAGLPETVLHLITGPIAGPMLRDAVGTKYQVLVLADNCRRPVGLAHVHFARLVQSLDPDVVLVAYAHGLPVGALFHPGAPPVVSWPGDNGLTKQMWSDRVAIPVGKNFRKAEVVALLDLLGPLGITTRIARPKFTPGAAALARAAEVFERAGLSVGQAIAIHLEQDGRAKFWPTARFVELIDWLHTEGIPLVLVGGRSSRPIASEIARERPGIHVLHGLLESNELGAVLQKSGAFIGCDSGPAHLAQAVGTPTVVLFGMTEPHRWGPLPGLPSEGAEIPARTLLAAAPGDWLNGEMRGLSPNAAMELLTTDRVRHACQDLVNVLKIRQDRAERH